jgi:Rieske 2Fe-2S family protein
MSIPAPLDKEPLRAVLAPLGQSRTLPAEAYVSHEILDWELEHFFDGMWVCVGRSEDVPRPGDQMGARVGTEGVLLVRDQDGVLRAFYNVCRHRGHELLPAGERTTRHVVKCPYHAWVYRLDGRLRGAPRFDALPRDDPVHEGLIAAPVRDWLGWTFVNPSATAPPFEEQIGSLTDRLAPYAPDRLGVAATHRYDVAANWKIVVENYHECYHCTSIHPELCRVTPPDSGVNYAPDGARAGGPMELKPHAETMSLSGRGAGRPLPGVSGERLRQVYYFGLFPNLLISPHPDYVLTHRIMPIAPDRTEIECQWLFDRDHMAEDGFDAAYAVEFWDVTNRQDWRACESVQRGVASRGYRPGPLAPEEDGVHWFLGMVARGYLGLGVAP